MKFAIRDDDISYFTSPEDLEKIYSKVWGKIPVSLSIIPFIKGRKSKAIPSNFWPEKRNFPIGENKETVLFLKEKIREKKISIMLHGYEHARREFLRGKDLKRKVKEGKEYLESLFEAKIKTFVCPNNKISPLGRKAVVDNGLNILGAVSFLPHQRRVTPANLCIALRKKAFQIKNMTKSYPFILELDSHLELGCSSLISSTKIRVLIKEFELARKYNGRFCFATHWWEVKREEKMKEIFKNFFSYVQNFREIDYTTADGLFF